MKITVVSLSIALLIGCATTPRKPSGIVLVQPIKASSVTFDAYIAKLSEITNDIENNYTNDTCFAQVKNQTDSILYVRYYKQQRKIRKYTSWFLPIIIGAELIQLSKHPSNPMIPVSAGILYTGSIVLEKIVFDLSRKNIGASDIAELNSIIEAHNTIVLRNYYQPSSHP